MFKASTYLAELNVFHPNIYSACVAAMNGSKSDLDFVRIDKDAFVECSSESIDIAVMEKTKSGCMVPLNVGWSDVGSWVSLSDVSEKDNHGNVRVGDILTHKSFNNYIRSENQLITTVGVEDLVIVSTKDTVMVGHKSRVDEVGEVIKRLKSDVREEWKTNREVYRPWGKYDCVDQGEGYQVKRITVNPGAKLSVQKHMYRSEHWVVVSGKARVLNGDQTYILSENESTYIPIGAIHSLENPSDIPLEIIEVQSGTYLGEDDIVRFSDIYGRDL